MRNRSIALNHHGQNCGNTQCCTLATKLVVEQVVISIYTCAGVEFGGR